MIAATGSPQSGPMRIGVPAGRHLDRALRRDRHSDGAVGAAEIGHAGSFSKPRCSRPGLPSCIRTPRIISCTASRRSSPATSIRTSCPTRSSRPAPTTSSSASAMTAPSASWPRRSASPNSPPIRALPRNKDRIANRDALRAELAAVFSQHDAEPLCDRLLAAGLPAGPVQSIDQALTSAAHRPSRRRHRKGLVQGGRLAGPPGAQQAEPAPRAAEFQPARHRGAGRVRIFQGRDRCPGRQGVVCGPERKR